MNVGIFTRLWDFGNVIIKVREPPRLSGVVISWLLREMLLHLMRVGSSDSDPFKDFRTTFVTRRPYFASFSPLDVVR